MSSRHFKPALYACCALAGTLLAIGVTGAGASAVWNGDFETANLSQYNGTYCYQSYSCSVVSAPGGHSGFAGRFQIGSGETSPIGSAHAQVQQNSSERIGDDSWWHWEVYLPAEFKDSLSFWQVVTEWHHYALGGGACNCNGSPPLTFQEINGRYVVRIVNSPDSTQGSYWTQFDLGPAPRGGWTTFDLHAKWSDDRNVAVTDVYTNGALAQHITGHPNQFTGYYNYFLTGWYRAADGQAQTIYLDNVRRGTSLVDVQTVWTTLTSRTTSSSTPTTTAATTTTTAQPPPTTTTGTTTTTMTTTTATTTTTPAPAYSVSITSPASGTSLDGLVTWTAQASGAATVQVDFLIDGVPQWTGKSAPYVFGGDGQTWDTTAAKNGSHTLAIRATASDGRIATASIAVTVNNNKGKGNKPTP
jgi:polysaccharide lyase-like protein/Big-like domain-containing protein